MSKRIDIEIIKVTSLKKKMAYWQIFSRHHYLDKNLNSGANVYVAFYHGVAVALYAVLRFPSGSVKNAYRGHRLVVSPDYQGLGIGSHFSDAIAQLYIDNGYRFFAKTANMKLGLYRENSPLWKATCKNKKRRKDIALSSRESYRNMTDKAQAMRLCYSHEYVGFDNEALKI